MANEEHVRVVLSGQLEQWRRDNPDMQLDLRYADLSRADLSSANLSEANLSEANLSEANLRGADLRLADLSEANLSEANLRGADLRLADLRLADLRLADLSDANLSEANLSYADLDEANLSEAKLGGTVCSDVNLASTKGHETIEHFAPSLLSFDILFGQSLPEVFLRGCGVPENVITYLPSFRNEAIQFYSCFISYSHEDKAFARRLHDALQGRGIRCWLDEHQLLPGDDMHDRVDEGIRVWDKVLLCASESSLKSWWVDRELNSAFQKEARLMKQRKKKVLALIPLDLDGHLFRWENGKADEVRSRLAADFTGWKGDSDKFDREFERVVKALRTDGGQPPPPESKL